jgi:hypothetical protein
MRLPNQRSSATRHSSLQHSLTLSDCSYRLPHRSATLSDCSFRLPHRSATLSDCCNQGHGSATYDSNCALLRHDPYHHDLVCNTLRFVIGILHLVASTLHPKDAMPRRRRTVRLPSRCCKICESGTARFDVEDGDAGLAAAVDGAHCLGVSGVTEVGSEGH